MRPHAPARASQRRRASGLASRPLEESEPLPAGRPSRAACSLSAALTKLSYTRRANMACWASADARSCSARAAFACARDECSAEATSSGGRRNSSARAASLAPLSATRSCVERSRAVFCESAAASLRRWLASATALSTVWSAVARVFALRTAASRAARTASSAACCRRKFLTRSSCAAAVASWLSRSRAITSRTASPLLAMASVGGGEAPSPEAGGSASSRACSVDVAESATVAASSASSTALCAAASFCFT